jgi:hypothetical protein
MPGITAVLGVLKAAFLSLGKLAGFLGNKKLLDAGEARAANKAHKAQNAKSKKVTTARTNPSTIKRVRKSRYRD